MRKNSPDKSWRLLIASPALLEDAFKKSVVMLLDDQIGVIINRPMSRKLGEISHNFKNTDFESVPVFEGGPVGRETISLAMWLDEPLFGFSFGMSWEDAGKLALKNPDCKICAFLGYAGWGEKQLEEEIKSGAWIECEVDISLIMGTSPFKLWETLVLKKFPQFKLLEQISPDIVESN